MTSLTGSVPDRLKDPASRVVVNARIPQLSKSVITSFGTAVTLMTSIVNASDGGAQCVQAFVDALVAALYLPDIVDEAGSFGAQGRQQHRHSRADVGGLEECAMQPCGAMDQRTVRVAENNARTHSGQLVDEEHSRLKHFFVHQYEPLALGRGDNRDGHRIGRERRPRLILELRDVAAHICLDLAGLLRWNDQVWSVLLAFDAKAGKTHTGGAEVLDTGILDPQLRPCHCREADERADFDVIGADGVRDRFRAEWTSTVDRHVVGADAVNLGTQGDEKVGEILDVGFAGGVPENCG